MFIDVSKHPKPLCIHLYIGHGGGGESQCILQSAWCPSPTATFIQPPTNTTVCLGSTAQFVCSATNGITVYYLVDSMTTSRVPASRGVSVSATTYSGNMAIVNLTILGTPVNNNSLITCEAVGIDGTFLTSSAHLSIQGRCTYFIPLLPFIPTHQVLQLLPLISTLPHTMILPPNWPGDHPLMPSPHPSSPMLW